MRGVAISSEQRLTHIALRSTVRYRTSHRTKAEGRADCEAGGRGRDTNGATAGCRGGIAGHRSDSIVISSIRLSHAWKDELNGLTAESERGYCLMIAPTVRGSRVGSSMRNTITVMNAKGGVGKSTLVL